MLNTPLRIGYINVQGLTNDKWVLLTKFVDTAFDILFLAETWHITPSHYNSHPFFVCSTPQARVYINSRQHGGLLCLCSLSLRSHISCYTPSPYTIHLFLGKLRLAAFYLPPSLPALQFQTELHRLDKPSIIIGDLNVHFKAGSVLDGHPRDRVHAVRSVLVEHSLSIVQPTNANLTVDHVLADTAWQPEMMIVDAPCTTDHRMIQLMLQYPQLAERHHDRGLQRFFLKNLEDVGSFYRLQECYNSISTAISNLITRGNQLLPQLDPPARQDLVNTIDETILSAVSVCCDLILGSYHINTMKARRDYMERELMLSKDATDAVRLYKRGLRTLNAGCKIQSRSLEISPVQEAEDNFTTLFRQPNPAFHSSQLNNTHFHAVGNPTLASFFTINDVQRSIQKYPASKSCGSDSIHIKILKNLRGSKLPGHISAAFTLYATIGLTPQRWNTSLVFPIPKNKESRYINEFRPIALTHMFRRLFERGVLQYLLYSPQTVALRQFHPTQGGFRRGFSSVLHGLVAHETAILEDQYQCFLDLRAAYDMVPVPLVLKKMEARGADMGTLSIIESLFLYCSSKIVVNDVLSTNINRERGLFQGSILAPFLFNVFIDDLARSLDSQYPPDPAPHVLLFADDIKINHRDSQCLQHLLDLCGIWAVENGMIFSIPKCGVISPTPGISFELAGTILPAVDEYRYLGFPHRRRGIAWGAHLANGVEKARKHLAALTMCSSTWPEWVKLAIFKAFIRPVYEYGAPVIYHWCNSTKESMKPVEALQTTVLNWVVGVAHRDAVVRSLTGVTTVSARFTVLAVKFLDHLRKMHSQHPAQHLCEYFISHRPWPVSSVLPRCRLPALVEFSPQVLHLVGTQGRSFTDVSRSSIFRILRRGGCHQ